MTNSSDADSGQDDEVLLDGQIEADIQIVALYAKEILFPKCKFVYAKEDLDVNGRMFRDFKKECGKQLGGKHIKRGTEELYLRSLWERATKERIVSDQLNSRRSAVYTVMMNRFSGKLQMVLCIVRNVLHV